MKIVSQGRMGSVHFDVMETKEDDFEVVYIRFRFPAYKFESAHKAATIFLSKVTNFFIREEG